jgi:hypothetical protein
MLEGATAFVTRVGLGKPFPSMGEEFNPPTYLPHPTFYISYNPQY